MLLRYENMSVQYEAISKSSKNDIFVEAVLTSNQIYVLEQKKEK